jgi:ribonuclease P protein component
MAPVGRIVERRVFARLRSEGTRRRVGPLSIVRLPEETGQASVAYALPRRLGSAVERNRVRRRLRAILRNDVEFLAPGWYLISLSPPGAEASYAELRGWVLTALHRLGTTERPPRVG